MASVKWEGGKCHGAGETKAHFRHNEKEQRLAHEHKNEHINKDLTPFNYSMYGLSYAEMCEKYDRRIAELAPNTRMTKKTVTCQILEITVPEGLPKDKQPEWFRRVHEIIVDFAGERNVIEGFVDVDEVHEYTDARTKEKRMSREHLHEYVIPTGEDGRLNHKEFSMKKNLIMLNNLVEEMSVREFGIPFNDGSKRKSTKTVEELKVESATIEAAQQLAQEMVEPIKAALDERAAELDERELKFQQKADRRERLLKNKFQEADEVLQQAQEQAQENARVTAYNAQIAEKLKNEREAIEEDKKRLKEAMPSLERLQKVSAMYEKQGNMKAVKGIKKDVGIVAEATRPSVKEQLEKNLKAVQATNEDVLERTDRQRKPDGLER